MSPMSRSGFAWLRFVLAAWLIVAAPSFVSTANGQGADEAASNMDLQSESGGDFEPADGAGLGSSDKDPEVKEEIEDQRFVVVLTIGDEEARALRRDGNLRASLPAHFRDRVDSVLLRHPTTFLKRKLVIKDDVDKIGRTLLVNVDESIVDRLGYQPIMIKVYQSGYDTIVLKYPPSGSRRRLASIGRASRPRPRDSPQVFVRLSPENGTTGWVRNMKSIKVTTEFGSIDMPLAKVRGIRFNSDSPEDVAIVSVTGDYFTGKIEQKEIVLATRWGDERIPVTKLESITYDRDIKFLEGDPKAGNRWVLTKPAAAAQPNRGLPNARPIAQPAQPFRMMPLNQPFPVNPAQRGLPNRGF